MQISVKKLSTCLWFDTQSEEAANFNDKAGSARIMGAFMQMKKFNLGQLTRAYEGEHA